VESSDFYVGFKDWCLQTLQTGHVEGDGRLLNTFRRYVAEGLFTRDEALELLLLMFAGALKTTSSFLAVMSLALMDRWSGVKPSDLLEEQVLVRYVEECLRFNPIVPRIVRQVVSDTSVSGVPMRKGSHVIIDVRAANKDSKRFENPEVASFFFSHPRHLTFGAGIHHCIGMHMARHQIKAVLPTLIERIGSVRHISSEWTIDAGEHHFYHPHRLTCRRSKAR
jgi:cytochrome P450